MRKKIKFSSIIRSVLLSFVISTTMLLSGCEFNINVQDIYRQIVNQISPQPTSAPFEISPSPMPEITTTLDIQETPSPENPTIIELEIWLPPQFDPNSGTPAGNLLNQRIKQFESQNQDVFINVRIKPVSGPTSMLEALTITSEAAQAAMPSLAALSRSDLSNAVTQQLVYSFDSYSSMIDEDDWYQYARNLTIVGGSSYGLPFAGDSLVLLNRPEIIGNQPVTWAEVLRRGEPLSFPASDSQALFTMALYQAAGGNLENAQRLPQMDPVILTQVFQLFADGGQTGVFPLWTTELQKDSDAWTVYNELRSNWVITWSSRFLQDPISDTAPLVFPIIKDTPVSIVDGWVLSITDPNLDHHPIISKLAEFLTSPDFLRTWSPEAGVLPVRPSSLIGWQNQNLINFVNQVALSSRVKPRNEVITTLGPLLTEQVVLILSGKTTAPIAAQTVIDKFGNQ